VEGSSARVSRGVGVGVDLLDTEVVAVFAAQRGDHLGGVSALDDARQGAGRTRSPLLLPLGHSIDQPGDGTRVDHRIGPALLGDLVQGPSGVGFDLLVRGVKQLDKPGISAPSSHRYTQFGRVWDPQPQLFLAPENIQFSTVARAF